MQLLQVRSVNSVSRHRVPNMSPITFTSDHFKVIDLVHDDPYGYSVEMANCIIKKTLADQGSSIYILLWNTFNQMDIHEFEILPHHDPLFDFFGEQRTARECYMVSLRLCPHTREEAPKVIHHVEAKAETKEVEELELDLRTNNENQ
ncbi:hypothetical protein JHK82_025159 [Glycine max]|nr:hypothetical protein JHK82_025159 [Glycine max]